MVSLPLGEERGEGPDLVHVDKELLATSPITSGNLMDDLPVVAAFRSSFGQVTRTDGCFLLLCVLITAVEE